ncbi:MAG: glycosyltransferase family protein [Deferribacterales bacterium]|nr:glycosyltransferase family protein [Deferribacterales bacterium]
MNTGIIIQARQSSTRLPSKIMLPLGGKSVLGNVIDRAKKACPLVIVATTEEKDDDLTVREALKYGAEVFRGSLNDVLLRYVAAAEKFSLDRVVRITSDCPCIDGDIILGVLQLLEKSGADYASNVENRTFPHGMDTEAFTMGALLRSHRDEICPEIREHVTLHIRRSDNYKKAHYVTENPASNIRITLDTHEDYTALQAVFALLGGEFSWQDIAALYQKHPWLYEINGGVYQKNVFLNKDEELAEAVKLLELHNMRQAAKLVAAGCR